MGRDRAEYMREYRARKRRVIGTASTMDELADLTNKVMGDQASRIADLEEVVRHLKAKLAARPSVFAESERAVIDTRKAQQRRDAILRKINRGG